MQTQNLINAEYFGKNIALLFLIMLILTVSNISAQSKAPKTNGNSLTIGTCDTAGPIEMESSGGTTTPTAYASLNAAFAAINAGTHQGSINVEVCGNTTETVFASLNASGSGAALYTNVTMRPVGGARIIEGTITGAIIKLTGADNVTIDGRQGGVGTARDLTVRNNSTLAATAAIWLTSTGTGAGATNNVIRNLELSGGATQNTSTNSTFGIIQASNNTAISTTSNSDDNDNNSFIANRIVRVRYGIVTRGTTTNLALNTVITDNIIGPTAFGTDQIGKVGILMQADQSALVSRNIVQFVGGEFANTTGGADRVGIGIGSESWSNAPGTLTSNTYTVTNNIVRNIVEERTFSSVGLQIATTGGGAATSNLVVNNFIFNIKSNGTSGDQAVGVGIAGGHTDTVAYNSISMTGDVDPNAGATATTNYGSGIRIGNVSSASHANLTLQNNSVYMDLSSSSAPTVRYYAISGASAAYSFGTGSENNNNYYINPANIQLQTGGLGTGTGVTLTTQFATLATWQAAYTAPQDSASIQGNPNYSNIASDLHINSASPNINAATTIGAVTTDIDGEVRPNGGSYDIGADEFYANPGQLRLSSTTYSGNEGTSATITVERINGSSGAVTVDYATSNGTAAGGTCGTDDYVPASGTLTFGDTVTLQNFTVTLCTDLTTDPLETVNIALSNVTGGATLATPNTAILTIGDVPPPFNGTYTVGTAGTFQSLTNAGGIFETLNIAGANGNVTINITSDLTGETGANALNELAGGFTVLIKPSGGARNITGSLNGTLIRLNGADNVTINGSTTASLIGGNASLRELTIQNTNTGVSAGVIAIQSIGTTNGATNNTIRNVNVLGQDPTTSLLGIAIGGPTPGTAGTDNDNNRVINCSVKRTIFGIYAAGQTTTNPDTGTVIRENDLSATTTDRIRRVGILVFNQDGIQIVENSVGGIESNESADTVGIGVGTQGIDTTFVTNGGIINAVVSRNKINGINSNNTFGFSAAGITVAGGTTGANIISNNMISGVISNGTSPDFPVGVFVAGVPLSDTKIYYNSISMTGDRGTTAGQMPSYGVAITGTDALVELKNNIFYTTQTSGGGAAALSFAIATNSTTFTNFDSNYNVFWSTGANDGGFRSGTLAATGGTSYPDVATWATAISDDANSIEVDPLFASDLNDLHVSSTSPARNIGIPVSVTIDHDGQLRPNPLDALVVQVDIGADEFYPPTAAPANISGKVVTGEGQGIRNATIMVTGGSLSQPVYGQTGSFGNFNIEGLATGETYVVTVISKRFTFVQSSFVVTLEENVSDIEFIGDNQ